MKKLMKFRKFFIGGFTLIMCVFTVFLMYDVGEVYPVNEVADYYLTNALAETTSSNVVTAIYLNYRVFDTMFEALLLLIAVTAILFIYPIKKEKEEQDGSK